VARTPGVAVLQGRSPYPNIGAFLKASNTIPFQVSILPGFVCGWNLEFDLIVSTLNRGTFTVPVTLPTGSEGAPLRFNNNTPVAIPDSGSVTSSIVVASVSSPIAKVRVAVYAPHTADGDLEFTLVSPSGLSIDLSSGNGGTGDNYGTSCSPDANRTTFDDDAGTKILAGTPPFRGSFVPEELLAQLIGHSANGTWRLIVRDVNAGDTGSLQCWSLFIHPATCAAGDGVCASCLPTVNGTLTGPSPVLPLRIARDYNPSSGCGTPRPCPGTTTLWGPDYRYRTHTFTNTGAEACVTVVLNVPCPLGGDDTNALQAAAYLDSFNPNDVCANYLADSRDSAAGDAVAFSFAVPAGARFIVVVNEVNAGDGCGTYSLNLFGLPCPPPTLYISRTAVPNQVRVYWPDSAVGYQLQTAVSLTGPWGNVAIPPELADGYFNVTNTASGPQRFFRLRHP
jgi:subtilisin-like proprotein convertase family protein